MGHSPSPIEPCRTLREWPTYIFHHQINPPLHLHGGSDGGSDFAIDGRIGHPPTFAVFQVFLHHTVTPYLILPYGRCDPFEIFGAIDEHTLVLLVVNRLLNEVLPSAAVFDHRPVQHLAVEQVELCQLFAQRGQLQKLLMVLSEGYPGEIDLQKFGIRFTVGIAV